MLRRRRRRRFILLALLEAVAIAIVIAALVLWRLTWTAPDWYAPPNPSDQAIINLADTVEYRLVEEAQKIRPPQADHWTLRVQESQINAWLSARLPKWIAHEGDITWPPQLGTPQIRIQPEGISIALPIDRNGSSRTIVARLKPAMAGEMLVFRIDRLALGRISLPGEPLANLFQRLTAAAPQAADDPRIKTALDLLSRGQGVDPNLKLQDGRRIRLINFTLGEGRIDLIVQTLE